MGFWDEELLHPIFNRSLYNSYAGVCAFYRAHSQVGDKLVPWLVLQQTTDIWYRQPLTLLPSLINNISKCIVLMIHPNRCLDNDL